MVNKIRAQEFALGFRAQASGFRTAGYLRFRLTQALFCLGHGCSGRSLLLERKTCLGWGMDALVQCSGTSAALVTAVVQGLHTGY